MKYTLTSLAVLSLYATHIFASPIADLEERDEDCYMEWITVDGDAPTGSSASPIVSADAFSGAGKAIMRHSQYTTSTAAASAESSSSATAAAGALNSDGPVESANQSGSSAGAAPTSQAASSHAPSSIVVPPTAASSSAASSAATSAPSTGGSTGLSPGGKKAGISGFEGVTSKAAWNQFSSKISWYSDYTPNPADSGSIKGIGMVCFPALGSKPSTGQTRYMHQD